MKSHVWKIIAIALVAALVAFTIYDTKRSEQNQVSQEKTRDLLRIAMDDVIKIELLPRGGTPTVLEKKGEDWFLVSPLSEPADGQEARNFLMSIHNEKSQDTVAEGSELTSLATYGLDSPPVQVRLTAKSGATPATETIKIGGVKSYDSNLYAQIDDEKKVLLVSNAWDVILTKSVREFRSKNLYRADGKPENVESFEIAEIGQPKLEIKKETVENKESWVAVDLKGNQQPLFSEKVEDYIESVKALRAQDFHAEDKTVPGMRAKFHLAPPSLQVRLKAKDVFYTLEMSSPQERGDAYAVSSDLKQIVSVFKMAAQPMYRRIDDFLDRKQPFRFVPADIAKINLVMGALHFTLENKAGIWEAQGASHPVDPVKVKAMLERMSRFEALRIFETKKTASNDLKKNQLTLSKADGTPVLIFSWGAERIEKATPLHPEAKYVLATTNKNEHYLGLAEPAVAKLDLADLFILAPAKNETPAPRRPDVRDSN